MRVTELDFPFLKPPSYPWSMSEISAIPETLAIRELFEVRRVEFLALLAKYGATNPKLFGSVAQAVDFRYNPF